MIQCDATSGNVRCDKDMGHRKMHSSTEGSILSMWASGGDPAPCGFFIEYSGKLCALKAKHKGPHNEKREAPNAVVQAKS